MKPQRIRLSRARGWRMPPNSVKVDRSTRWGNPFIVGRDGSTIKCVYHFILLTCGYTCLSVTTPCYERQKRTIAALKAEKAAGFPTLRGKNLACWCKPGAPCHADALLAIVNRAPRGHRQFDLEGFLASYGWRVVNGKAERIAKAAA